MKSIIFSILISTLAEWTALAGTPLPMGISLADPRAHTGQATLMVGRSGNLRVIKQWDMRSAKLFMRMERDGDQVTWITTTDPGTRWATNTVFRSTGTEFYLLVIDPK